MRHDFAFRLLSAVACVLTFSVAQADPLDIHGPPGSVHFGRSVTALPNGNFVVTDPDASSATGAVYLYGPDGTLIATLKGSAANDQVGNRGITVVGSNFVVSSTEWKNGAASRAGAITWVNGSNGHVVGSSATANVVSAANSLVGTHQDDSIAVAVSVLSNGNYVVSSQNWNAGTGAATWCKGDGTTVGPVSAANSLTGSAAGDNVGGVVALSDGNYVALSPNWSNPATATQSVGAATWVNGSAPFSGTVSAANSLIGTSAYEGVGYYGAAVLPNGRYVVASTGAATWRAGGAASAGTVSAANSLMGPVDGVVALSNGNYVVRSSGWNNGAGAATWGNGVTGISGAISAANSLTGSTPNDAVGYIVTVLPNGKYVVGAPGWTNNGMAEAGAVILLNGNAPFSGTISASNALIGTHIGDRISDGGIVALSDGNYVVVSANWNHFTGATTWANGATGTTGPVTSANSPLYGWPVALADGNYAVIDSTWGWTMSQNGFGAVMWCHAGGPCPEPISEVNSLHGTVHGDMVGVYGGHAFSDGNYVINSGYWTNHGAGEYIGAMTLGNGRVPLTGEINASNSVIGGVAGGGIWMTYDYNPVHHQLVVGRPDENIVTVIMAAVVDPIFASGFEP